jgi:glycosyltransferase involved in cell wall biosynthesis
LIRLAVAAPARLRCGVADYARFLRPALAEHFEVLPIDFPESIGRAAWIRAAAAADEAQLVHVHYEYSLFRTVKPYRNRFATFMRRLRPPAVVTLHDLLPRLSRRWGAARPGRRLDLLRDVSYAPWFGRWETAVYRLADHWLVHTEEHRQAVAEVIGAESVSRFVHPVPQTGVRWHRPTGGSTLLSLGFVKPHKGYLRFLEALQQQPSASWIIAGGAQDERDRRYLEALESRSVQLGVAGRVRISGYLERAEIERLAAEVSLAVFPFDRVTGSGSVAWAIGLGMPIAATDLPPLQELVQAGAGLELLPLARPESWADRISGLLGSPERLATLAAANRAFSRQHGYADLSRHLRVVFDNLLASVGGREDEP